MKSWQKLLLLFLVLIMGVIPVLFVYQALGWWGLFMIGLYFYYELIIKHRDKKKK